MPTIKTKKEMNLGELLCWAIDNKEQARFRDFSSKNMRVRFNASGYPCIEFEKKFLPTYETFTVEIEEEITEDTKLLLIERFIGGMGYANYTSHGEVTINDVLKRNSDDIDSTHFYIENDEREPILIWRDGKLVE